MLSGDNGGRIVSEQRIGNFHPGQGGNPLARLGKDGTPQLQVVRIACNHVDGFAVEQPFRRLP